jgi:hypothetical protein
MKASPNAATTGTSVSRANPRKFGRMKLMPMRVLRRDCTPPERAPREGAVGGAAVLAMVLLRPSARAGPLRPARATSC